jgi:hypothetical protein
LVARARVQARSNFVEFGIARPHPYERKDPRRRTIDPIERAIVEPRAYPAYHPRRRHRDRQTLSPERTLSEAAQKHMSVKRLEACPEPIVDAAVVVPPLTVGHRAIEREMRVELGHLRPAAYGV